MRIDHVIYGTADLDAATARLEAQLGLQAVGGGRHDGLGTHNRIIPLGGGFLEVLAVADEAEAAASELGRAVGARLRSGGDGLVGWAAAVDDVDAVAQAHALSLTTIGRQGMTARLAGVAEAMAEPGLPFFIERDPGIPDPGAGRPGPGIGWLEVAGDASRVRAWLAGAPLPVRVVDGVPALRAVGIGDAVVR